MDPITPIFERYQRKFTYECNDGILSNNEKEVILSIENLSAKTLPVPTRDGYSFEGWYSDWHHTVQVADKTGKVIVGKDWLDNDNFYDGKLKQVLYAKWKPIKEVPTYKVLLVFVTEAHALLESTLHGMIQVDYVMNEDERKICESIVVYVRDYLNALLNGTVNFEVDSYFTKEPIGTKNFNCGSVGYKGMVVNDYGIYAERNLPEVEGMLDDYGSVLTTFCMNDYKSKLHRGAGAAGKKYGYINLEEVIFSLDTWEKWNDFSIKNVFGNIESTIEIYMHEFTHTVEMQLKKEDSCSLHNAMSYYGKNIDSHYNTIFSFLSDYLIGNFYPESGYTGIPYEFWTGEYFN